MDEGPRSAGEHNQSLKKLLVRLKLGTLGFPFFQGLSLVRFILQFKLPGLNLVSFFSTFQIARFNFSK